MKEVLKLVVVLTLVGVLAGLILSYVNDATEAARAYQDRLELLNALSVVLPEHTNEADKDVVKTAKGTKYYISKRDGKVNGCAFVTSSDKGYGGKIRLLVGVDIKGKIHGVVVLEQHETPGLGAKIAEEGFLSQFRGRDIRNTHWKVKKDGGDIDQITGATISPRAVVEAIKNGLERLGQDRDVIYGGSNVVQ
ncbi:MAG: electron transporter RnfG [Deltaproteobacteria bacterium]|nr:MAG: electron transporter RnfG [Deltaproteobacteria bacterium]